MTYPRDLLAVERPRRWLAQVCGDDLGRCGRLVAAFAAVYLIWGSTYLAIRIAIETMPPFLMAGSRFVIAGALLYGWAWLRGAPRPRLVHWRSALIIGGLLLLGGNGGVTWAEQEAPSSLAALIIASTPIWFVLLEALRPGGALPGRRTTVGVLLGFAGIALLIGPAGLAGEQAISALSLVVLLLAPLWWAAGSLYSRRALLPRSPQQANGIEMLAGGALLLLAATATGEWSRLDASAISLRSATAFVYLVVFGSIIGFSAYLWLLKATSPAKAATYAYVNPVVAVLLGWALAGETVTASMLAAMTIILFSVALISTSSPRRAAPAEQDLRSETGPSELNSQ